MKKHTEDLHRILRPPNGRPENFGNIWQIGADQIGLCFVSA